MAKLSDYRDLLEENMSIDYASLGAGFWDSVGVLRHRLHEEAKSLERAMVLTYTERHREFTV